MRSLTKPGVVGTWALVVALMLVATAIAETPKHGGTLVIGAGNPRHLNPAVQSGGATGIPGTQIFAGLIQLDERFQAQPYLATHWIQSADGLRYTFHLVKNATFHDGQPITSADVAFSLEVVKENHPFGVAMFDAVEGVDTPDPTKVVIRLKKPHPALLPALSPLLMPVIPKHVYGDGQDVTRHPANSRPVGSGPFKFVEWKSGEHIILERNERFFRRGRPYLRRIVLRSYRDQLVRRLALERGDIHYDSFAQIRYTDIAALQRNPDVVVTSRGFEALGTTDYIEFNLRRAPFNDVRVRRAIAHAIDRDFIVNALHVGLSTPLHGPFNHQSPWAAPDHLVRYDYNLGKAKALLDAAGLKPDKNGVRFTAVLDAPPFSPDVMQVVAEYLKPQLRKVGIKVELRPTPDFPTWANRVSNWEYDFTMNNMWNYPDPTIGVHRAYLCNNQKKGVIWSNTEGYCNPKLDELLTKAGVERDFVKRKALYAEVQAILTTDLPFVWTTEDAYFTVYHKFVKNPPLTVWGAMAPMDEVWLDR